MNIGAIVFDTNAIKILEDEHVRSRVIASLRVVDLGVRLSAVNVLELAKTENVRVRNWLLGVADALSSDRWILPLPGVLLRLWAKRRLHRRHGFRTTGFWHGVVGSDGTLAGGQRVQSGLPNDRICSSGAVRRAITLEWWV